MARGVTSAADPDPGWYDDGVTPHVQRWFDGTDWTEHTRPLPEAVRPPAPAAAPSVPGGPAATGGWAPAQGGAWLPADHADGGAPLGAQLGAPAAVATAAAPALPVTSAPVGGWAPAGSLAAPTIPDQRLGGHAAGTFPAATTSDARFGGGPAASPWSASTTAPVWDQGWQAASPTAHWGWRVLARLLDELIVTAPYLTGLLVMTMTGTPAFDATGQVVSVPSETGRMAWLVGAVVTLVLWVVNRVVLQGGSGRSWGKRIVGLRLVHEDSELPLGAGRTLWREVMQVANGLLFGLGYLWPLWDVQRQTFADKVTHAVVLREPR